MVDDTKMARPYAVTCGVASVNIVQPTINRSKLVLVNDSANIIYVALSDLAVINTGIRLNAEGGSVVIEPDVFGKMWQGPVSAIASGAASNLCVTEEV